MNVNAPTDLMTKS